MMAMVVSSVLLYVCTNQYMPVWIKQLIHKEMQSQAMILPFAISKYEPGCFVSEDTYINFWLVMSPSHMQLGVKILKLWYCY